MKIKDIINFLNHLYPLERQEDWDHSGLQIGNINDELKGVMVCLNADEDTISQAINQGCNLLISHHPFLFHSLQSVDYDTVKGRLICQCIHHHLTVYSMHTNYDCIRMNEHLLEILGCQHIHCFEDSGICRAGYLENVMDLNDFIYHVKKQFNLNIVRLSGFKQDCVYSVAICGGSGASFFNQATNLYDIYITGDFNYNHATELLCLNKGLVLGVPHFIERVFKQQIILNLKDVNIFALEAIEQDYFTYY